MLVLNFVNTDLTNAHFYKESKMEFVSFLSLVGSREKKVVKNLFLIFAALVTERFSENAERELSSIKEMKQSGNITRLESHLLFACILLHVYYVTRDKKSLYEAMESFDLSHKLYIDIDARATLEGNIDNNHLAENNSPGFTYVKFNPTQAAAILLIQSLIYFEIFISTGWFISTFMSRKKDLRKRNALHFVKKLENVVTTNLGAKELTKDGAARIFYDLTSFVLASPSSEQADDFRYRWHNQNISWRDRMTPPDNLWVRAHIQNMIGAGHQDSLIRAITDDHQRSLFIRYPDIPKLKEIGRYYKINETELDAYLSSICD
jgi:hypothetical protein